ncbi:hypothetical protein [Mycolicibacterium grossiae]|uniref:hypothetical protein n=1 Tax=Mycolicibacterium grossiae TaxID=1552759 RepID=UPI000F77925E|nr:hypothetical protein [Mycolicibacterium grossiae]QEM43573.1 hypothetical protein FZ046_01195 [Mycolicibacterium grossiae]
MLKTDNDLAPAWQASQTQIETLLQYLVSPIKFVHRVDESFDDADDELQRNIEVDIRPQLSGDEDFLFVAVDPRKGIDFRVDASSLDGRTKYQQLTHEEHLAISVKLIITRFHALLRSAWRPESRRPSGSVVPEQLELPIAETAEVLARLRRLPSQQSIDEAKREVNDLFDASGKLRVLADWNVDHDQTVSLYNLCQLLAERWLTIVRVPTPDAGNAMRFRYSYCSPYEERLPSIRARLRKSMGGAPFEFKIHAPLAKRSRHYNATMTAPTGMRFKESVLVTDTWSARDTDASHRTWGATKRDSLERRMTRLPEDRYRKTETTTQRAQFFLEDGYHERNRLYIYTFLYETPPGTLLYGAAATTMQAIFVTMAVVLRGVPPRSTSAVHGADCGGAVNRGQHCHNNLSIDGYQKPSCGASAHCSFRYGRDPIFRILVGFESEQALSASARYDSRRRTNIEEH